MCFIYRISINLSSFTDRDWNETFYRNITRIHKIPKLKKFIEKLNTIYTNFPMKKRIPYETLANIFTSYLSYISKSYHLPTEILYYRNNLIIFHKYAEK